MPVDRRYSSKAYRFKPVGPVFPAETKVKVRTLTNCNACHQEADEGSFGLTELYIPGLTGP
jgi:hypothetical protein